MRVTGRRGRGKVGRVSERPGSGRPLRADAEANRQRILAAAAAVFSERGLAVPMEEIAAAAGVGVGTLYRRFPDRHHLIEALFEERLSTIVALAEQALLVPDGWDGLVWFLDRALSLQIADRGLAEILRGQGDPGGRVEAVRDHIAPVADRLVMRARESGRLRPDFDPADLAVLQLMVTVAATATADLAPQAWRRYLVLLLDGMVTARDQPTFQTVPPLTAADLTQVIRGTSPPDEYPRTRPAASPDA
jgi:AcrR family transcriptional regulator